MHAPCAPVRRLVAALTVLSLAAPAAAASADRDLYVSSRNTDSVKRYDGVLGTYIEDFVEPQDGGLGLTQECVFGPDGHLYVTGLQNAQVLRYHGSNGSFLGPFTHGYDLANPTKLTYGPDGWMYVSQWDGDRKVIRFDPVSGAAIGPFTDVALVNGCGHAWDGDGILYVAFFGVNGLDGSVARFDTEGNSLGLFPEPGHLQGPVNVWFRDGDLFVLDWTQGSVERFDGADGSHVETFISGLENAEGFTFGPDGLLYICDWTLNQVNRYLPDGTFDKVFAADGGLLQPNSVTFGPAAPTAVLAAGAPSGVGVRLLPGAPNPFRSRTVLRFELPDRRRVAVRIFDVLGRHVASLVDGELAAGIHRVAWHPDAVPGGIYFARLETDGEIRFQRLLLAR